MTIVYPKHNKILLLIISACIASCFSASAQSIWIAGGTSVTVTSGTALHTAGLTLTPSENFTLAGANTITRNSAVANYTLAPYISRAYKLANTTSAFTGTVQFNYLDNELNNIPEADLRLNVHTGSAWESFPSATNDVNNNYVLSASLSAVPLNELALASVQGPLPVGALGMSTSKLYGGTLVSWNTLWELNTEGFTVQHSTDGTHWQTLGWVRAAGNSNTENKYSFRHMSPAIGNNYYRVQQQDLDGRFTYSATRVESFDPPSPDLKLLNNPVRSGQLIMQAGKKMSVALYSSDGKLLATKVLAPGTQQWDVGVRAKGICFLASPSENIAPIRVVLQ